MEDLTLVIPAKYEASTLPKVLDELEKFNVKKIITVPKYDKETDFHVIELEMSDYQFEIYEKARVEERQQEKSNRKKKSDDDKKKCKCGRVFQAIQGSPNFTVVV